KLFDDREKAGSILETLYSKIPKGKELHVGRYQGFDLYLKKSLLFETYSLTVNGERKYLTELGKSNHGNMVRLDNLINSFEDRKERLEEKIEKNKRNLENAKKEYEKTWIYEEEYKEKLAKL